MGVSYFCYTSALKTMIICTCFWLAAKSVQSDTIYEKLIGSKIILETFRDFWELQCSAVMQFRKEKLQYDSAVQYCNPMLSSSAAMQCCTAMWHCNVAFVGGSPVTHLQTLAWNAIQPRASKQASKQASNHTAAMPCCNAMLHGNVTMQCCIAGGSPVTHLRTLICIAIQRNATQRKGNPVQCNAMKCCKAMLEYIGAMRRWQCFRFIPNLLIPLWLGSHAGVIYIYIYIYGHIYDI